MRCTVALPKTNITRLVTHVVASVQSIESHNMQCRYCSVQIDRIEYFQISRRKAVIFLFSAQNDNIILVPRCL